MRRNGVTCRYASFAKPGERRRREGTEKLKHIFGSFQFLFVAYLNVNSLYNMNALTSPRTGNTVGQLILSNLKRDSVGTNHLDCIIMHI